MADVMISINQSFISHNNMR